MIECTLHHYRFVEYQNAKFPAELMLQLHMRAAIYGAVACPILRGGAETVSISFASAFELVSVTGVCARHRRTQKD